MSVAIGYEGVELLISRVRLTNATLLWQLRIEVCTSPQRDRLPLRLIGPCPSMRFA